MDRRRLWALTLSAMDSTLAMVLGDNIFAGHVLKNRPKAAVENVKSGKGATAFGYYVDAPEQFGIVEFDKDGKVICKWCPATASVAEQNGRDAELSGHLFL